MNSSSGETIEELLCRCKYGEARGTFLNISVQYVDCGK